MSEALQNFRQEPRPALGLINPYLDQAGSADVVVFLAGFMGGAEIARQCLIIGVKFCQHFFRGDTIELRRIAHLLWPRLVRKLRSIILHLSGRQYKRVPRKSRKWETQG